MTDWSSVPTFGRPDPSLPLRVRPSAYALVLNPHGQLAIVQTPRGVYLPGGGSDPGETAAVTVQRETAEETGLDVAVGVWRRLAIDHVVARDEGASFEKRSTFCDAVPIRRSSVAVEQDHSTVWVDPADAVAQLSRESHRWAVGEWLAELAELAEHGDARGLRPAAIAAYLADIVTDCAGPGSPLVSLILFGSAAMGGYTPSISDVDLLLVLDDQADPAARDHVRKQVAALEQRHHLAKHRELRAGRLTKVFANFADRLTANVRAFFVCTRADLLSGAPERILGLPPSQARFVDRVAIPSIVTSARTVWGEHLLDRVPLPPIRRLDVAKAFVGLFNQALLSAALYALVPDATKYAMDALKRSVHNCYFCYHLRPAPLGVEISFFDTRYGPSATLAHLSALRREYRPSFGFIVSCLPTLALLHFRTARDVQFPRHLRDTVSHAG